MRGYVAKLAGGLLLGVVSSPTTMLEYLNNA